MHHSVRLAAALCLALALPAAAAAAGPDYRTWYLAEGSTAFFEQEILIGNPNATDAEVTITYMLPAGQTPPAPQVLAVKAFSRATVRVNNVLVSPEVSARITSTLPIVVERSMYWGGPGVRRGGHNSTGVVEPRVEWYLAEGVNTGVMKQYILLANPNASAVHVQVRFLGFGDGLTETAEYHVPANGRVTVQEGDMPLAFRNRAFSARVRAMDGVSPIIVERAIYWGNIFGGGVTPGGTNSTGLPGLSDTWQFAEGYTGKDPAGGDFQTFILLGNPNAFDVVVDTTFYTGDGNAHMVTRTVKAQSRENVWVNWDDDVPAHLRTGQSFSVLVQARNGAQIAAERAMYWGPFGNGMWREGHAVGGVTTAANRWAFAEGVQDRVGGLPYDTFFLLNNATNQDAVVKATFVREDGTGFTVERTVNARTRGTIWAAEFAALSNQRFAAFIESSQPIVAERATYWGGNWHGGHASAGVPWFDTFNFAGLPTPPAATASSVSPNWGSTNGGTDVTIKGTNFARGAAVVFGGVEAGPVLVADAETIIATTRGRAAGTVAVEIHSGGTHITLPGAFTYEAPPPPPPPPTSGTIASGAPARVYCDSFASNGVCTRVVQFPGPNASGVIYQLAAERGDLLNASCREHGGNNEFMFEAVRRLRAATGSNRWGLNWKRGNVGDLSQDIVTYFYGPEGTEMQNDIRVYIFDIISNHCGSRPGPNWEDVTDKTRTGNTIGRWTTAGRF